MTRVMFKRASWLYWSFVLCPGLMAAMDQRNRLRALGYMAEVI